MNGDELRDLLASGWGVGNHSWSHEIITPESVEREIGQAKQVLEDALGEAIILYCSPGDNTNMADHVLEACRRHDYLGAMSLTDALNLPGDELSGSTARRYMTTTIRPSTAPTTRTGTSARLRPNRAGSSTIVTVRWRQPSIPTRTVPKPSSGSASKRSCPREAMGSGARYPKKRLVIT